jgi:coenzyme F420-reducing hydrogenase alpha subunit
MKISCNVDVHHLTRVEGHGNIRIEIRDGAVLKAEWSVVETPRFFEAILKGKRWENAPWITGRICGICSIGHTLASIRAIENAFGFTPPRQTERLRLLLKHAETLQSHILHLYFLVAPDFVGTGSVFPLIDSHPDIVARAARLKQLANDIADTVGGRRLHPTRTVVGGFTMLPTGRELEALRDRLRGALDDLAATATLFATFKIPAFARETEYVSLRGEEGYPFVGGRLMSSDGVVKEEHEYAAMTNEYCVPRSTSKWSRLSRESFAVGALARVNNNYKYLAPEARALADRFALRPVTHNPYMNNIAQLVECLHVTIESIGIIDELLGGTFHEPREAVSARAGKGVGAVEVPRGILYHAYTFDEAGIMTACDCVIPTSQNHANIQHDIAALADEASRGGVSDDDIRLRAEMLVRAYDPCISCSVH